jgi:phage antirepressor YoqD-like protein
MNEVAATPPTMSSQEIAELTGKTHPHVMRDIRRMLKALGKEGVSKFGDTHTNLQNGQTYPIFKLDKDHTLTLLLGYDAAARFKVVQRWQELERAVAAHAIPSHAEALRLAADNIEGRERAEAKLAIAEPKADALDRLRMAVGGICVTNAAKNLNVPPKRLFKWLEANHWIYRRAGGKSYVAYQEKIVAGFLEHKHYTATAADGTESVREQVLVTGSGLAQLALDLPRHLPGTPLVDQDALPFH